MLTSIFAEQFAAPWIAAWNSHDLTAILSHYTEDFEMASPFIAQVMNEPSGKLQGKPNVAAYWAKGLERSPDLHFELLTVLTGADSVTLYYRNHRGQFAAEVFWFAENGKVEKAAAHYTVATN
jgi:ketosteroid isomerase-like protein